MTAGKEQESETCGYAGTQIPHEDRNRSSGRETGRGPVWMPLLLALEQPCSVGFDHVSIVRKGFSISVESTFEKCFTDRR